MTTAEPPNSSAILPGLRITAARPLNARPSTGTSFVASSLRVDGDRERGRDDHATTAAATRDDRPARQRDRAERGSSGPHEEDDHEPEVHREAGHRVEPDARRRDRSIDAGLLQVAHVERHAADARGREVARERGGDLRQQRRDRAQARRHRAADGERGADVGQRREQHDERDPAPVARNRSARKTPGRSASCGKQEVRDRHEHRGGEDALPADPFERHVASARSPRTVARPCPAAPPGGPGAALSAARVESLSALGCKPRERGADRVAYRASSTALVAERSAPTVSESAARSCATSPSSWSSLAATSLNAKPVSHGSPSRVDEHVGAPKVAMRDAVLAQARRPAPTARAGADPRPRRRPCGRGDGPRPSRRR